MKECEKCDKPSEKVREQNQRLRSEIRAFEIKLEQRKIDIENLNKAQYRKQVIIDNQASEIMEKAERIAVLEAEVVKLRDTWYAKLAKHLMG